MEAYSASPAPVHDNAHILFPRENAIVSTHIYDFDGRLATYAAILFMLLLFLLGSMAGFAIFFGRRQTTTDGNGANNNIGNGDAEFNREASPGLEQKVIESFPVFRYSLVKGLKAEVKASDCVVCLCDFEYDEMVRLLPECHHAFHPECIDMWFCSHTTCPVCRTSLVPEGIETQTEVPPEQVAIVIEDDSGVSISEGAPDSGHDLVGSSLIRVQKDMPQATEWYIATPEGLMPGMHRSCSFIGRQRFQSLRRLKAVRSGSHKPGRSVGSVGCGTTSETVDSISENPALIFRTFSERISGPCSEEGGGGGGENVIRKKRIFSKAISVDFQDVLKKRTFSWLGGGDQEVAELSQSGPTAANA
ncbi:hypothetical protein SUGI_0807770 [Cryptomeria japonica]|uniref:RING-H2 finger protein ATL64-like n=1 Tax=Cryptomeria japonica TaxID=3369 RepID=UPI002414B877|nr:RING-H2 finger protein ATL64-like [Cryptomeria japonica]GLJ39527.1 hypothetical protein SUGI_0807770 [Cryptomeria japonica]